MLRYGLSVETTLYRRVSTSDAYVIDTLWSVKRSQRGFRVVIGDDDNLETTLSPVPQMTPLKVRCHLCTDDNVVSKLSSTVKNVFSKVSSFWGCKRIYDGVICGTDNNADSAARTVKDDNAEDPLLSSEKITTCFCYIGVHLLWKMSSWFLRCHLLTGQNLIDTLSTLWKDHNVVLGLSSVKITT